MFGVILLPNFALQAVLRHQSEAQQQKAVALLGDDTGAKTTILQRDTAARNAGVEVGMTASQGLGRCASLHLLTRSPEQEATVATVLLESAFSCSPWVEATADGVCTFELRNARSDPATLAERMIEHLARLDLEARVGFAANPDLALLAAHATHAAAPTLVVDDAGAFLADLPIAVLNPSPHASTVLHGWGIATFGALGALPPQELTRRLGQEGRALWERASGRSQRLLRLAVLPVSYEESLEFEYEVQTLEPLLFVLRRFLNQLVLRLEAIYRVPAALTLRLRFEDDQEYRRHFSIPAPTNCVETLFRVLHTHLENFTAPALIQALFLAASPALASREQFGLFETALRDPNRFSETLARLHALLGSEHAGIGCPDNTHRPDAFHVEAPNFLHLPDTPLVRTNGSSTELPTFGLPLRRLRPPLPLDVEVNRRVPAQVTSSTLKGSVRAARGPYQLLGDWWQPGAWTGEEWDVELVQGGLYRLSRQPEGWFLEGTYD